MSPPVGPGMSSPYPSLCGKALVPSGLLPVPTVGHVVTVFNGEMESPFHVRPGAVRVGSSHLASVVSPCVPGVKCATCPPLLAAIGFTATLTGPTSVSLVTVNR